jgi:small subunit ribosomal protein S6
MTMPQTPDRLYDQVFLIVPDKDEQAALQVVETFRNLLVQHGAKIEKDESMGRRRLAFTIKKRTEATYHNFLFRGDGKAVAEVERRMRLSDDVLRFLTVRVDEEMKHGQKVAKRTKPRTPRRIDEGQTPMAQPPQAAQAAAPAVEPPHPPAAPEPPAPEEK